jgi:hypothetical protein
MATCPRCFQEKPLLADKCPNCTADVPVGQQIDFSISSTIISVVIVLIIISFFFG